MILQICQTFPLYMVHFDGLHFWCQVSNPNLGDAGITIIVSRNSISNTTKMAI